MAQELTVDIVDWGGAVWSGTAKLVTATTSEGAIGLLPRHEPLLALLRAGEVKIVQAAGPDVHVGVTGGFLSVDADIVTVVADDAEVLAPA
ncbi:MAG: F0F1 ATP synthase subunit epsilon [Bifidobacteriaceae bacterium]|jgi:F-type H+-transporting ATPase subunit epsilon|nr:F0F1 ATP synthase subunit epsilon [Bifidobacteriaceae bacterium]